MAGLYLIMGRLICMNKQAAHGKFRLAKIRFAIHGQVLQDIKCMVLEYEQAAYMQL